ncbi:hypothetical protein HWV00_05870 [Moritella sp. 24]|uniref:hypothetical protein n=1 Tax=Moritella sp. 24 TaxID=2746230 RepID=UPI001BADDA41|nr:hypothetical protein [Moritella sp. 24]QUM75795.1 hypothetical protein HWV00_05870 [Moritella sp. 24]
MKKLIYIALICISVLAVISYIRDSNNDTVQGDDSEVMLTLFSMKTSNDFIVTLPDTGVDVKLTKIIGLGTPEGKAQGDYQVEQDRGEVLLDYRHISPLNLTASNGRLYFVAPFSVSNQGSGLFHYIGLFEQDFDSNRIRHVDSYFIGDRIQLNEMRIDESSVDLSFNQHGDKQAYAEAPSETVELTLTIDDVTPTKLIKYQGM